MLTRWANGSISGEATTQSGNIFPEAMRPLRKSSSVAKPLTISAFSSRQTQPGISSRDIKDPADNRQCLLEATGLSADTHAKMIGSTETVTRDNEYALPCKDLAQGPRIPSIEQPGERDGSAARRNPADNVLPLLHESLQQAQIALRDCP